MTSTVRTGSALLCLLTFVVVGCAKNDEYADTEGDAAEPAAMPAPGPAEMQPAAPAAMQLEPKNESGVTGQVTATRSPTDVTVQISLNGLTDGVSYPAHIHSGTCASEGPVAAELTSVSASGTTGSSTTTVELAKVPDQAFVQVHDASGKPIACTDLGGTPAM